MQTATKKQKAKSKINNKKKKNNHLQGQHPLHVVALNSSRCKLKMSTHIASDLTKDNKVQPVQSSLCLNTPKMPSCFLEVMPDQIWLCTEDVRRGTQLQLFSHIKVWALVCLYQCLSLHLSGEKDTGEFEGWKCATRSAITSRSKWLQEYPKRGPPTMHHHGLNGNAPQHQTMAHALTYGGSSTTNFHHLLQFQWEWKGPRQRVMDRSFGVWTQQWQRGPNWWTTWVIVHAAWSWSF